MGRRCWRAEGGAKQTGKRESSGGTWVVRKHSFLVGIKMPLSGSPSDSRHQWGMLLTETWKGRERRRRNRSGPDPAGRQPGSAGWTSRRLHAVHFQGGLVQTDLSIHVFLFPERILCLQGCSSQHHLSFENPEKKRKCSSLVFQPSKASYNLTGEYAVFKKIDLSYPHGKMLPRSSWIFF